MNEEAQKGHYAQPEPGEFPSHRFGELVFEQRENLAVHVLILVFNLHWRRHPSVPLPMNLPIVRASERSWLSNTAIPLTPALSPGERVPQRPPFKRWFRGAMREIFRGGLPPRRGSAGLGR